MKQSIKQSSNQSNDTVHSFCDSSNSHRGYHLKQPEEDTTVIDEYILQFHLIEHDVISNAIGGIYCYFDGRYGMP